MACSAIPAFEVEPTSLLLDQWVSEASLAKLRRWLWWYWKDQWAQQAGRMRLIALPEVQQVEVWAESWLPTGLQYSSAEFPSVPGRDLQEWTFRQLEVIVGLIASSLCLSLRSQSSRSSPSSCLLNLLTKRLLVRQTSRLGRRSRRAVDSRRVFFDS